MLPNCTRITAKTQDVTALARLWAADRAGFALVRRVLAQRLTYLRPAGLTELRQSVIAVERGRLPGAIIEAGCALGGSALIIAATKTPGRPFLVYDAFGMIPPPSEADGADGRSRYEAIASGKSRGIRGDTYYGYRDDLLPAVIATFKRYDLTPERNGVTFVRGLYELSLRPTGPIALAHIDCDWYESVMVCLERIEPLLVPGGVLVIDDYFDWSGCRKAVDTYFAARRDRFLFQPRTSLHIHKLA